MQFLPSLAPLRTCASPQIAQPSPITADESTDAVGEILAGMCLAYPDYFKRLEIAALKRSYSAGESKLFFAQVTPLLRI